jgi:hypothetical protein
MPSLSYTLTQLTNQYFEIDGLIDGKTKDSATPTYINNATGTFQLKDPSGVLVIIGPAGATSAAFAYVATSNGNYQALVTSVFDAPVGPGYRAIIDLTAAGGFIGHWEPPVSVRVRSTP